MARWHRGEAGEVLIAPAGPVAVEWLATFMSRVERGKPDRAFAITEKALADIGGIGNLPAVGAHCALLKDQRTHNYMVVKLPSVFVGREVGKGNWSFVEPAVHG